MENCSYRLGGLGSSPQNVCIFELPGLDFSGRPKTIQRGGGGRGRFGPSSIYVKRGPDILQLQICRNLKIEFSIRYTEMGGYWMKQNSCIYKNIYN